MLSIKRLKELGFNVNYDSEEAVAHTARVLIKEIMGDSMIRRNTSDEAALGQMV